MNNPRPRELFRADWSRAPGQLAPSEGNGGTPTLVPHEVAVGAKPGAGRLTAAHSPQLTRRSENSDIM